MILQNNLTAEQILGINNIKLEDIPSMKNIKPFKFKELNVVFKELVNHYEALESVEYLTSIRFFVFTGNNLIEKYISNIINGHVAGYNMTNGPSSYPLMKMNIAIDIYKVDLFKSIVVKLKVYDDCVMQDLGIVIPAFINNFDKLVSEYNITSEDMLSHRGGYILPVMQLAFDFPQRILNSPCFELISYFIDEFVKERFEFNKAFFVLDGAVSQEWMTAKINKDKTDLQLSVSLFIDKFIMSPDDSKIINKNEINHNITEIKESIIKKFDTIEWDGGADKSFSFENGDYRINSILYSLLNDTPISILLLEDIKKEIVVKYSNKLTEFCYDALSSESLINNTAELFGETKYIEFCLRNNNTFVHRFNEYIKNIKIPNLHEEINSFIDWWFETNFYGDNKEEFGKRLLEIDRIRKRFMFDLDNKKGLLSNSANMLSFISIDPKRGCRCKLHEEIESILILTDDVEKELYMRINSLIRRIQRELNFKQAYYMQRFNKPVGVEFILSIHRLDFHSYIKNIANNYFDKIELLASNVEK